MTTWEYKILDAKDIETARRRKGPTTAEAESFLNSLGADGWEIMHLDGRELERRMSFTGVAKREGTST